MTDLEITRLCAEAMGLMGESGYALIGRMDNHPYDPLHDDAQAMGLVKKFGLRIEHSSPSAIWTVQAEGPLTLPRFNAEDLNRAVCECVARMQAAK